MDSRYINALEQRLKWAKWANSAGEQAYFRKTPYLALYNRTLWEGETFFMNSRFCQLVDYARQTIPDDLEFEAEWMPTKSGWMLMEEPFEVPSVPMQGLDNVKPRISAVGWHTIRKGDAMRLDRMSGTGNVGNAVKEGTVLFCCFQDMDLFASDILAANRSEYEAKKNAPMRGGFGMWSHFVLQPGEKVLARVKGLEQFFSSMGDDGVYRDDKTTDMLHEVRWVYTAMHLMSEKLATTVEHRADRHARKRLEREKFTVEPMVKLITLRRMEEHRAVEKTGDVEWQWQWRVQGHWRNQWYPSEGVNKLKWIEEYIKGPVDKPLKPAAPILYKVER